MNILVCTRQVLLFVKGADKINKETAFPGGVRRKIANETAALEKRGHTVELFDGLSILDPDIIDVVYLVGASTFTETICWEAVSNNIDFVVSPIFDNARRPSLVKLAAFAGGFKHISTNPGSIKYTCASAKGVCVRSDSEKDEVIKLFGLEREKVFIVPDYINPDNALLNTSKELFVNSYGIDNCLLAVGAVGNPRKNFLRLIRVAGDIGIPTVIIGPDFDRKRADECRKAADQFDNVHIIGTVSDEMLWSAYAAADTLVMPSTVEGTGLVALEAALMGANVIATEVGGPSYYLGEYAAYVNPRSDKSIKSAIEKVYGSSQSLDLKEHILINFNIDTVGEALEKALEGRQG